MSRTPVCSLRGRETAPGRIIIQACIFASARANEAQRAVKEDSYGERPLCADQGPAGQAPLSLSVSSRRPCIIQTPGRNVCFGANKRGREGFFAERCKNLLLSLGRSSAPALFNVSLFISGSRQLARGQPLTICTMQIIPSACKCMHRTWSTPPTINTFARALYIRVNLSAHLSPCR